MEHRCERKLSGHPEPPRRGIRSELKSKVRNGLTLFFAKNKVALEADLEAGKSYYVGTNVRMGAWKARMNFTPVTRNSELWDKVDDYKKSLNFIAVVEEERGKWEVSKRQEAQGLVDYYSQGPGKGEVLRLNKEDGR